MALLFQHLLLVKNDGDYPASSEGRAGVITKNGSVQDPSGCSSMCVSASCACMVHVLCWALDLVLPVPHPRGQTPNPRHGCQPRTAPRAPRKSLFPRDCCTIRKENHPIF